MMSHSHPSIIVPATEVALRPWYREPQAWALALISIAIFLPRLTTLTIRGEESRRAVIAREMIESGDWVVPRTQGVVRLSRPPFQNWLIALGALALGGMNAWAVRLPGLLGTTATVVLVYWYARRRLQPTGALIAGLAYASMLQVLEQGRTGETEPVFTALIAAALLLWHGGWLSGWRPEVYWSVGAAFAALATLTKGLQAPLYFFATTWAFLLLMGQWRHLLSRGHVCGVLTFAAVVGVWQAPFISMMGWENGWLIYVSNVAKRFHDNRWSTFLVHLLTYPVAVIAGCLAPWSLLFVAFLNRDLRRQIGPRRDMLLFLVTAIVVCFPSVWLPPEARPRYFMPLFPCFAVLAGMAAELMIELPNTGAQRIWSVFRRGGSLAMFAAAVGLTVWSLLGADERTPPLASTLGYALIVAVLGLRMHRLEAIPAAAVMTRGSLLMTAFLALTYVGPMINYQQQRSENLPAAVAELRTQLPEQAHLVSFDHVHHVFLHYFDATVPLLPWPTAAQGPLEDVDYFCVHVGGTQEPQLPFAWEPVASLSVDRNHHAVPNERILVGRIRRTSPGAALSTARASPASSQATRSN